MMVTAEVIALDGHDGAGKTTLSRWLAMETGGSYQRPFGGALGEALLLAATQGQVAKVLALGEHGITNAIAAAGSVRPVILDRAWMTVASLVNWEIFVSEWHLWIPTVMCWADIETTLMRLKRRGERPDDATSHCHYLALYQCLANRTRSFVIRTDLNPPSQSQCRLMHWLTDHPSPPQIEF